MRPEARSRKPDFLGIGAQKSATTWLWANLRRHPDIWLPPVKELHYFSDRAAGGPGGAIARLTRRDWANRRLRGHLRSRVLADLRRLDPRGALWDLRYFFGRRDDDWYRSLFDPAGDRTAGEITPAYSILSADEVGRIRASFPELRIVLLLRDPIDRAWSQLRGLLRRLGTDLDALGAERAIELVRSDRFRLRSAYGRTLDAWSRHYPEERRFTGFFEDVAERPEALLEEIHRFLGVEPRAERGAARASFNRGGDARSLPPYLERALAEMFVEDLRETEARVGGRATGWLRRAEAVLDDGRTAARSGA